MPRRRNDSASAVLKRLKVDPLKHLAARFHQMEDGPEKDQLAREFLPYAYAKLKTVEVTTEGTVTIRVVDGDHGREHQS